MIIEREKGAIVIRPDSNINLDSVQKLIDYINVLEISSQKQGTEEEAAALAAEIDTKWWKENKHRFIK